MSSRPRLRLQQWEAMTAAFILGLFAGDYLLAFIGPVVVWICWATPTSRGTR